VELAISELELNNIKREKILAIPLGRKAEKRKILDSINQSDGISFIDISTILATVFMVLGVIYGFVLKWGPVIWGLIGLMLGAVLGFIIDIIPKKKGRRNNETDGIRKAEVVIIIDCDINQAEVVENILMSNLAIGIGRFDKKV
jgi:hypothetical protein